MALEPFAQRRVALGCGLDLAQGGKLGLGRGMLALRGAEGLPGRGAALFEQSAFALQRFECFLGSRDCSAPCRQVRTQCRYGGSIRRGAGMHLALQTLAALAERLRAALQMGEVGLLELQRAFSLLQLAARLAGAFLPGAERLLRLGQPGIFTLEVLPGFGDPLLRRAGPRRPHVKRLRELGALLAPCRELRAALGVLAFEPAACLLGVAQL